MSGALLPHAQTIAKLLSQLAESSWPPAEVARVHAAYDVAVRLFSARFRASGKPFVCHLVGTASILAGLGRGARPVCAALLHSAYAQGDFGALGPGPTARNRRFLREAVGLETEALVAGAHAFEGDAEGARGTDPEVKLLRAADTLEEAVDADLLLSGPAKRTRALARLAHAAGWADDLGEPRLAAALREAKARLEAAPPHPLAGRREGSYRVVPRSLRPRLVALVLNRLRRRTYRKL